MISIIIAIWVWTGIGSELPCEFIELPKSERRILMEYLYDCERREFFPYEKGLVMLTIESNKIGQKRWNLIVQIDDRYKNAPPRQYTMLNDYMILIDDIRINKPAPDSAQLSSRIKCLEEIIGSRVYRSNDDKDDISVAYDIYGNVIRDNNGNHKTVRRKRNIRGGNFHNELIIDFKKDGSIQKIIPV